VEGLKQSQLSAKRDENWNCVSRGTGCDRHSYRPATGLPVYNNEREVCLCWLDTGTEAGHAKCVDELWSSHDEKDENGITRSEKFCTSLHFLVRGVAMTAKETKNKTTEFKARMKNGLFWDVTLCGCCKNRRLGGT
jgi:hypothetical protein